MSIPRSEEDLLGRIEGRCRAALAAKGHRALAMAPRFDDDCAWIAGGAQLITGDTLCEGVHFDLRRDSWRQVGAQAAVVNLSDLAASAAQPRWALWQLSLPPESTNENIEALTEGFAERLAEYQVPVVGGNLCRRPGPSRRRRRLGLGVAAGPGAGPSAPGRISSAC